MYNSNSKVKLASDPLVRVNREYYNPFFHTPPTGLENNITLRSLGPRQPISVSQKVPHKTKLGEDANKDEDYGQFVEMGGKRIKSRKMRKNKQRKSKKSRKSIKSRKMKKSKY